LGKGVLYGHSERSDVLNVNHISIVMLIVTMRRKTKLYASWVLLVCIVMIIGYFALLIDRNVTVYDDNFKILYYSISKGTTHTIYKGNQTVGRMRAILQH
jgi:hypothetical protein